MRRQLEEARGQIDRLASELATRQEQLSAAGARTRQLNEEFAAFRHRRSVRAAAYVADVAYATVGPRSWLRRHLPGTRTASIVPEPMSVADDSPEPGSNISRWDARYAGVETPKHYDDTVTYRIGAEFLSVCDTVEDWGCGLGWMRNFVPADRYVGVDGSVSRFADRVADLETYRSEPDGIFMRHVLEHNFRWERILANAIASFRRRFVLVTFTPYGDTTREIAFHDDPGVPDISFAKEDLTKHFAGLRWREETFSTDTQYGTETVFFVERVPDSDTDTETETRAAPGDISARVADTPNQPDRAPLSRPTERPAASTLKISAVVPCFNGTAYLEEALSSIKNQTRPVHEIIVVDDGSTDGSADLAERCGAKVIRHGVNRGEGAARNTGWRAATGDAIAWLDADDVWRPHHVEVVGALMERHPDVACAFGGVQRFGLDDRLCLGIVPIGEPCELLDEAFRSWLHASIGCLMRRAALEEIGGYDERRRISVDFDLWLRLARRNRFVATDEVTANWRWHEAQQSAAPLGQIIAVHGHRRRFLKDLRATGEHSSAEALEALLRPSWHDHLNGVLDEAEQARKVRLASLGRPYRGPTFAHRTRRAVLSGVHPSITYFLWRSTHRP